MSYLSLTDADREEMLAAIGVSSVEELFRDIPEGVRYRARLGLEPALSEPELVAHLEALAARNVHTGIGMGYVPAELAEPGRELTIDVRGRHRRARVVKKPIYRREE